MTSGDNLPYVEAMVLCAKVDVSPVSTSLVGIFNLKRCAAFPCAIGRYILFASATNIRRTENLCVVLEYLRPDHPEPIEAVTWDYELVVPHDHRIPVELHTDLSDLVLTGPGEYRFVARIGSATLCIKRFFAELIQ